jgi:hypothetical protein
LRDAFKASAQMHLENKNAGEEKRRRFAFLRDSELS